MSKPDCRGFSFEMERPLQGELSYGIARTNHRPLCRPMAQSRRAGGQPRCPHSGAKRTCRLEPGMSAMTHSGLLPKYPCDWKSLGWMVRNAGRSNLVEIRNPRICATVSKQDVVPGFAEHSSTTALPRRATRIRRSHLVLGKPVSTSVSVPRYFRRLKDALLGGDDSTCGCRVISV
jgi:hypothetical protein